MDDPQVQGTIEQVVAEQFEVSLHQCRDLLCQRRALREVGRDPSAADLGQPEVVEGYEQ
jgi:hypothetical protein